MYNDEFNKENNIDSSSHTTPEQNSVNPSEQQNENSYSQNNEQQNENSYNQSNGQQNENSYNQNNGQQNGNSYNGNNGQGQYGGQYNQNNGYGNQRFQQNQNSFYQYNGQQPPLGGNDPKKPNKWKKTVAGIAIAAGIMVVGGTAAYGISDAISQLKIDSRNNLVTNSEAPDATEEAASDPKIDTAQTAEVTDDSVSPVVENVMPSIVSITTTTTEMVSDFFGRTYSEDVTGSGSGIIIGQNSSEVLIVTNNHVISGNDASVVVTFNDGKDIKGIVKGADQSSDLAVVAVKFADVSDATKEAIKVISLGDSDKTKVGEMAIAIGNALGVGQSVTVGHISALKREINVEDSSMTLMQTDAAINPGNSGGALLNAKGQLIGINSAKTATTGVEGMGYAIPISDALPIIQDLMEGKDMSNDSAAYLGIVGQNITESNSKRFNIPVGVYVSEIAEGSPAAKAGIKQGMIIVGFDGKEIKTTNNLMAALGKLRAGDMVTVNVAINRNGTYKTEDITVKLGSKAEAEKAESGNGSYKDSNGIEGEQGDDMYPFGSADDGFGFFGN